MRLGNKGMTDIGSTRETVFQTRQRKEALDSRLVLDAAGIESQLLHHDGWWSLEVHCSDLTRSNAELAAFREENSDSQRGSLAKIPVYIGAGLGVTIYAIVIVSVFVWSDIAALEMDWIAAGQSLAGQVVDGQWWRVVTALTLHADTGHILGNLVFGSVYGLLAGRVLGGGIAWLTIVLSGSLGNFINALVQQPTHGSIGSSTAVFAALGVIVAHALRPRSPVSETALKRYSPLIGGVLLLALTGIGGERTDVVAHFTGFIAGLATGWLGCRLPNSYLANAVVQITAGVATIAIVAISWIFAITSIPN